MIFTFLSSPYLADGSLRRFVQFVYGVGSCPVNASIKFKTKEQDERHKPLPDHEGDDGSNGAIEFVVGAKIGDIKGEAKGNQQAQAGGKDGAERKIAPFGMNGRAPVIDCADSTIEDDKDYNEPEQDDDEDKKVLGDHSHFQYPVKQNLPDDQEDHTHYQCKGQQDRQKEGDNPGLEKRPFFNGFIAHIEGLHE